MAGPQEGALHAPAGFELAARKEHAAERELIKKHSQEVEEEDELQGRQLQARAPVLRGLSVDGQTPHRIAGW